MGAATEFRRCPYCTKGMPRAAGVCPYCHGESRPWTLHEGRWWTKDGAGRDLWLDERTQQWRVYQPRTASASATEGVGLLWAFAKGAVAVAVLVAIGVFGCSPGGEGGGSEPVGSDCTGKLASIVDEDYLADQGLEIRDSDAATIAVGGAIAEVCMEASPDTPADEAAERVVRIIRARHTVE